MRSVTQFLKVEGHNSLVRDVSSNAIISTNDADYNAFQKKREIDKKNKQLISDQLKTIETLKCEMSEIKSMLSELLKGKQ